MQEAQRKEYVIVIVLILIFLLLAGVGYLSFLNIDAINTARQMRGRVCFVPGELTEQACNICYNISQGSWWYILPNGTPVY